MIRAEWMSWDGVTDWFLGAGLRFPGEFVPERLRAELARVRAEELEVTQAVPRLRQFLLTEVRDVVGACQRCPLGANRLKGRPVFDCSSPDARGRLQGAVSAAVMLVGTMPDELAQRTGQPFVSFPILAGSICARSCGEFDGCYPAGALSPAQPCRPTSLRRQFPEAAALLQVQTERARRSPYRLAGGGGLLDKALFAAGFWREGWNARAELLPEGSAPGPRPGSIYLTDVLKCRSAETDGETWVDRRARPEEIKQCARYLTIQRYIIQPRLIVALGSVAIALLTGNERPVAELRGQLLIGPDDTEVFCEVHPEWIGRQPDPAPELSRLIQTLIRARERVEGELLDEFAGSEAFATLEARADREDQAERAALPPMPEPVGDDDRFGDPLAAVGIPTYGPRGEYRPPDGPEPAATEPS